MRRSELVWNQLVAHKVAALSVLLLLLGSTALTLSWYYYGEVLPERDLSQARYQIIEFDILGVSQTGAILTNGTLRVNGSQLGNKLQSNDVEITRIEMELYYAGTQIGTSVLEDFTSEEQKITQLANGTLLISFQALLDPRGFEGDTSAEESLGQLLSSLLVDPHFSFDADIRLSYRTAALIGRTIEFHATIEFLALRDLELFSIEGINIPTASGENTTIMVEVKNPFTASLQFNGSLQLGLNERKIGYLHFNHTVVDAGENHLELPTTLTEDTATVLQLALNSTLETTNVTGALLISVLGEQNALGLLVDLSLEVSFNQPLLVDLYQINNATIFTNGSLWIDLDMQLNNTSPMNLNISQLIMDFTTLGGTYLGRASWTANHSVPILAYSITIFQHIQLYIPELNWMLALQVAKDGAISVSEGTVLINFFDETILVPFSIPRVPLTS